MTAEERFLSYVIPEPNSGCWLWTGAGAGDGVNKYGQFWAEGSQCRAHRWSYQQYVGSIPEGLEVCHTCDVKCCVNPKHLWVGTGSQNMRDAASKGRLWSQTHPESYKFSGPPPITHCKNGHLLQGRNVCYSVGRRTCLACQRDRWPVRKDKRNAKRRLEWPREHERRRERGGE